MIATSSTTWPTGSSSSTATRYFPWKGNYTGWLEQKAERMRLEEKSDKTREKTLEREFEWIKMSPKARQAKSKARIANYEELGRRAGAGRDRWHRSSRSR